MKKNKLGLILSGLYLLICIGVVVYAYTCNGMFCGLVLVLPVMPWPLILGGVIADSLLVFISLVIINTAIMYLLGTGISRLFKKDAQINTIS